MPGAHTESEDFKWTIEVGDHPERADTPQFTNSRAVMQKICATLKDHPYGPGPWQAHHGGSLWVYDGTTWRLFLNTLGMEWSSQFAADPVKVDIVRQNAKALYESFPLSRDALTKLGYKSVDLLDTPITDAVGVSQWVDSIFNSCVPLASPVHIGEVSTKSPYGGVHHYPKPIDDIQFFKQSDFTFWVTDASTGTSTKIAVVPVAPRGSGDGRVEVAYVPQGHPLHAKHLAAHKRGKRLLLMADHPLAKQAFARQK